MGGRLLSSLPSPVVGGRCDPPRAAVDRMWLKTAADDAPAELSLHIHDIRGRDRRQSHFDGTLRRRLWTTCELKAVIVGRQVNLSYSAILRHELLGRVLYRRTDAIIRTKYVQLLKKFTPQRLAEIAAGEDVDGLTGS